MNVEARAFGKALAPEFDEREIGPLMHISPPSMELSGDPTRNLRVNSLRLLAAEAERILELDADVEALRAELRRARETLERLSEASLAAATADEVSAKLAVMLARRPEQSESAAALWRDMARLQQDLTYLDPVERRGIDGLNAQLADLLELLCSAELDRAASEQAAAQINDLLRRAIYLFPHLAACVTLEIALDEDGFESAAGGYVGRRTANRRELRQLCRESGQTAGGDRYVLHLPLPYLFSAKSPAMRRRARCDSWEDLAFLPRRFVQRQNLRGGTAETRGRMRVEIPAIVLVRTALSRELGVSRSTMLLAREVVRIELSTERHYLQVYNARTANDPPQDRPDPLTHYLLFRDFGDIGRNPRLARVLDIAMLADLSLFEPAYATGLLDVGDDEGSRQWLERGFGYLALLGRGHAAPGLLRFEDVEIEYEQSGSRSTKHSPLQCALYRAALDPESALRKHATEFDGAGIIRELMQVPVADRRFAG